MDYSLSWITKPRWGFGEGKSGRGEWGALHLKAGNAKAAQARWCVMNGPEIRRPKNCPRIDAKGEHGKMKTGLTGSTGWNKAERRMETAEITKITELKIEPPITRNTRRGNMAKDETEWTESMVPYPLTFFLSLGERIFIIRLREQA